MKTKDLTRTSGQKCPESGIWKIVGEITTTQAIMKGDQIPEYCGKKVRWIFLYSC